jgi:hypothetical protein
MPISQRRPPSPRHTTIEPGADHGSCSVNNSGTSSATLSGFGDTPEAALG